MKQLTCEMCGGTDLVKDGGVFVCQTCGCKYSVEEAKKMMIEGVVEVTGTVRIDDTELKKKRTEELLSNALAAYEGRQYSACIGYVDQALDIDNMNYQAYLLKAKAIFQKADLYSISNYNDKWRNIINTDFVDSIEAAKTAVEYAPKNEQHKSAIKLYEFYYPEVEKLIEMGNRKKDGDTACLLALELWFDALAEIPHLGKDVLESALKKHYDLYNILAFYFRSKEGAYTRTVSTIKPWTRWGAKSFEDFVNKIIARYSNETE